MEDTNRVGSKTIMKKEKNMKQRMITMFFVISLLALVAVFPAAANRGDGVLGTVYVTSQGLYYDTFVSAQELPIHGPFQKLEAGVTEYGPGDRGYVGGRWWIDDGDGIMGEEDTFLLCPLLGPGRTSP